MAEERGGSVNTLGMLYIEAFKLIDSEPEVFGMNLPVELNIQYSEISKARRRFKDMNTEDDFKVLTSYKGELVIKNAIHVESAGNSADFLNSLLYGKLPESIKYSDLPDVMRSNAEYNGLKLGVPNVIVEIMMSELARDRRDNTVAYRFIAGKTGKEDGYESVRINDIPSMSGVFQSLAFENIDASIGKSLVMSLPGHRNIAAPTEKILYF